MNKQSQKKGRLSNKISLITGAAEGIGQAIAKLFLQEGATVIIADINDETGLKIEKEFSQYGKVVFMHLDVSDEKNWQDVEQKVLAGFGRLDVLVNNAGIIGGPSFGPQNPEETTLEAWRKIHMINLDGNFLGCKYAIRMMKKNGGSIINMSSRSGVVGVPGNAAYASSKAAVRNHSKSVALYCAQMGYNIRSNALEPASILTGMWKSLLGQGPEGEARLKELSKEIPLGRFGTPEEVAAGALFFASDDSSYITGTDLMIDGGILAGTATSPDKK